MPSPGFQTLETKIKTFQDTSGQTKHSCRCFAKLLGYTLSLMFTASFRGCVAITVTKCCRIPGYRWLQHTVLLLLSCMVLSMSVLVLGYGQTGPLSQRAGYDAVASAVSGLMHITGPEVYTVLQMTHNCFPQAF